MKRVYLTDRGRSVREGAMASHLELISGAMETLSPAEQQTLVTLTRKLERGLDTCQPPTASE